MPPILHITSRAAWNDAARIGHYTAPSLALEGFIHASTPSQLLATAQRYYSGINGLVILVIDPSLLSSPLKYEPVRDQLFPHIFGPINLDAVRAVIPFEPDARANFTLPPEIESLLNDHETGGL